MQRSLIAQGIAFGELAGYAQRRIAGPSVIPEDLPVRLLLVGLVLFVVSLIVFVALMGLLVLSGRALSEDGEVELHQRHSVSRNRSSAEGRMRMSRPGKRSTGSRPLSTQPRTVQ